MNTQLKILTFLKAHPNKWFNIKDLKKDLNLNVVGIYKTMVQMRKFKMLESEERFISTSIHKGNKIAYFYKHKVTL